MDREDTMRLKDVMTESVAVLRPESTLQEAALKMNDLDIGFLPICNDDHIVGTLTDRDITIRAVAAGLDATSTPVDAVMTRGVIYGHPDQDVEDAARLMEENQVRRLLVVDENERLLGVFSLGDMALHSNDTELVG